jgi:tetratricopeptide (TPR) repeat protein
MRKTTCYLFLMSVLLISPVWAGNFNEIEPGISTKAEAFAVLGKPTKEVIKNKRYTFNGQKFDLKVLSVVLYEDSEVIQAIELYPQETVYFPQLKEWFDLNDPFETTFDTDGNVIESFLPHAVRLHYDGPNNLSPILYFEHFDPAEYEDFSMLPQERRYLGLQLAPQKGPGYKIAAVAKASPAEEAGLLPGDVIIAINEQSYADKELDPSTFMSVLALLPINKEIICTIKRDEQTIEIPLLLRPMTSEEMEKAVHEALLLFRQGQFLLNNGDTYGALDFFKNALWLNPYEPLYYASIADAYYRIGLTDFAIDELKTSIRMSPQFFPYFLLGTIYTEEEDYDQAILYFTKALALDATDIQVREKLGYCFMRKDMDREALAVFQKVLEIKENAPLALFFAAVTSEKLDDFEKAIVYYKKYLATDPSDSPMRRQAEDKIAQFRN